MIKKNRKLPLLLIFLLACSCNDYLNVVPEGTATLENAFSMRQHTLRYLYTCYSYLPSNYLGASIDIMGGDEIWVKDNPQFTQDISRDANKVARGMLTSTNNLMGTWQNYYAAIRDCNNFLDGIETFEVPDLMEFERRQWIAEVKVLKAYYHFLLLRQYGPIPIIKNNLPISTDVAGVQIPRNTVDEGFDYIMELFQEAIPDLPAQVRSEASDLGRVTLPIATALRAQVAVTAASPLYNCNSEFAPMKNKDGTQLFTQDQEKRLEKWQRAVKACQEAIHVCIDSLGMELYHYPGDPKYKLSDTIKQQMTLRQAFCEDWNNEVIWADTRHWISTLQNRVLPITLNPLTDWAPGMSETFSIPLQIAEMFYSENGVPINEDNKWDYDTRYTLRRAVKEEGLYIRSGGETARLNFEREPRFYAWLGFPQGIWYGSGSYDDNKPSNLFSHPEIKGLRKSEKDSNEPTGYVPKKWVHYQTLQPASLQISIYSYIWPKYRLAELLLFYAEALNEASDTPEARNKSMEYIDMIRTRAGLKSVVESWTLYSNNPDKYKTQEGLREIIHCERLIELSFEGSRFWDLRRWKTARVELNKPIQGWRLFNTDNADIYKPMTIFNQKFGLKNYFWPISESELMKNMNLVQSLGW
ncbi:MAG TPA: RagB/SusD family nutrient uptake outer membrane protein [Porphyromonadaceae bacterium]|nr:RagB/SusD family nutrient uptake outer membrane protein [Porphyromonadaceae bacterium]HBK30647.1 RagB/SusD family nutrient uptake outer membrane protein [Porphyromonadaceae bacterium]HBL34163.1 RagB/SusD family nutrient uptake outer membrane protein [Porphyromonadaceae bacterium]HBX46202.1 RagB/SusD family nutrient uptake outer membrane protein [Porphyromonadaceae bacterium]HCM19866.1 RagB/SusD family nutrient uptake outer membrane protein [Porphyromonadaceae bacterium]